MPLNKEELLILGKDELLCDLVSMTWDPVASYLTTPTTVQFHGLPTSQPSSYIHLTNPVLPRSSDKELWHNISLQNKSNLPGA